MVPAAKQFLQACISGLPLPAGRGKESELLQEVRVRLLHFAKHSMTDANGKLTETSGLPALKAKFAALAGLKSITLADLDLFNTLIAHLNPE